MSNFLIFIPWAVTYIEMIHFLHLTSTKIGLSFFKKALPLAISVSDICNYILTFAQKGKLTVLYALRKS